MGERDLKIFFKLELSWEQRNTQFGFFIFYFLFLSLSWWHNCQLMWHENLFFIIQFDTLDFSIQ